MSQTAEIFNGYSQFVIYVLKSKEGTDKLDKIPVDAYGNNINAHDSKQWMPLAEAKARALALGPSYGVGFAFTEADPFFFLDIDNCLGSNNQWSPLAIELCNGFSGAFVEVSASGKGLHIIGTSSPIEHTCKNIENKIELYTSKRFVALTLMGAIGDTAARCDHALAKVVAKYFSPAAATETNEQQESIGNSLTDDQIIQRALFGKSTASIFGGGVSFEDLWIRNVDALIKRWPSSTSECGYDESAADASLAQRLAFYTNNDEEKILRIMLRSGLAREKWDRVDYLPRTVKTACDRQGKNTVTDKVNNSTSVETAQSFLDIAAQVQHFEGCVYVADEHKILIPGGYLHNQERFRVSHGGKTFVMDAQNAKTSRNAFEAFTEHQVLRHAKANTTCFRPDLAPATIIESEGQKLVNVFWPIETLRRPGDVTPFLKHMEKLWKEERDNKIMMSYLAAIVQYPGVKFAWCPLIQGVEGNGKTLITRVVAHCIGRRYTHFPKSSEICSRFNGWLYGKIFIAVEDIFTTAQGVDIVEILKPMITGDYQEIENKGQDKVTKNICANFIINTNHRDALKKTRNDRRFSTLYTAQQTVEDLKRDGMLGDYFPNLYGWLQQDGFARINNYLREYNIPGEFNPTTLCNRAPETSQTEAAIHASRGSIEQEIEEAIEENRVGFRGGWISSFAVANIFDSLRVKINHNKRQALIRDLGYIPHPALPQGRLNTAIDGGKPRLYVKIGTEAEKITCIARVREAYLEAQADE